MGQFFGSQLRKWRESQGLSGNKLAQLTGILQGTLAGIELGRRPPSDANLEAIAAVPEMNIAIDRLMAWRDLDKIGGGEGLERLRRFVLPVFDADRPYNESELAGLQAELSQFRRDFEAFKRRQGHGAANEDEALAQFVETFGDAYARPALELLDAAAGHPSDYWRSQEEARAYLEAMDLGESGMRNLLSAFPDLQDSASSPEIASGFGGLEQSQADLIKAGEALADLTAKGAPPKKMEEAIAALRSAITRQGEAIGSARAWHERRVSDLMTHLMGLLGPSTSPIRYNVALMQQAAKDAGSPLTAEETAIIRDMEEDGLFVPHSALASAWHQPPEARAWIFDIIKEDLQRARKEPSPFRKQSYEHRGLQAKLETASQG